MIVYPAIDLLDGQCVRLARGSFDAVTVYSADPVHQALVFAAEGAAALHVVDLDGARAGRPVHTTCIERIRAEFDGTLQVGGGIRSDRDVAELFEAGVDRILLGTAAVARPDWIADLVDRFGADHLAAAVDLRGRRVMIEGWIEDSPEPVEGLLAALRSAGIRTIVFTDTERDGTLGSANHAAAADFMRAGYRTIVAGGVAGVDDIRRLAAAGAAGVVIGSALYERRLTLADALAAAERNRC